VRYAKTVNSNDARELQARCAYEMGETSQP